MSICMLIARQRSGTGALNSILSQHENIVCVGEVFHPNNLSSDKVNYFNWFNNEAYKIKNSDIILNNEKNFNDYLLFLENMFPNKKIIIDIKYRSLHHFNGGWFSPLEEPCIFRFIRKLEIPCIHLTRNNFLETFVSGRLADMNRVWHTKTTDELKYNSIKIDIKDLQRYIDFTSKEVSFVKDIFRRIKKSCTIDYKELLVNNKLSKEARKKLEGLLNCSSLAEFRTPFIKQVAALEDVIENFSEVQLFLEKNKLIF